ncbi:MAG: DoxX family protein [Spirochaetales bacterium]|nr:DoxX family protein [Leptospiraceae bacterium]MCP5480983.1 DoxX family protein [Spirochaetales bacterium]MCP5485363.1 DoxX family protein [Spirochaetales bacterium]
MSKTQKTISLVSQILVALILGQTLFFKFTGAQESIYIFSRLGAEPWGRIGSGLIELVAIILILIPRTAVYGAVIALGTMAGAIGAHLFVLGIEVADDGGLLFGLAIVSFLCSGIVILLRRSELLRLLNRS